MSKQWRENYKRLRGVNNKPTDDDEDVINLLDLNSLGLSVVSGNVVGGTNIDVFASGDYLVIENTFVDSAPLFVLVGSGSSFIQDDFNNDTGPSLHSQVVGINNSISSYEYIGNNYSYLINSNFVAGSGNSLVSASWLARSSFMQGERNTSFGYATFTQGRDNFIGQGSYNSTAIGSDNIINDGESSFCLGNGNQLNDISDRSLAIGGSNILTGMNSTFIQGVNNRGKGGADSFIQGTSCIASGLSAFNQGNLNRSYGDFSFVHGEQNQISKSTNPVIPVNRAFVHGNRCRATMDDQIVFGSNRTQTGQQRGFAQKSRLVKHISTPNATPVTLTTLELEEDKTYSIRILVGARNSSVASESASFELTQALAYRDVGGAAILVNSPISLSGINSGGGATSWTATLSNSSNDILLRVVGSSSDSVEWCSDLEFVEVMGSGIL